MENQELGFKFPKWLPRLIAVQARMLLAQSLRPEAKNIVEQLVTRLEMKPVWKKLTNNTIQPTGQLNLIWAILNSLSYWEFMEDEELLVPPTERKNRVLEINDAINNLREVLKKHHLLIWDYNPEKYNLIDKELDDIERGLEYSIFRDELPTKINADSAKRTFLIKKLKKFMSDEYKKPFHAELATIISIVLNDQEITEATVRMT